MSNTVRVRIGTPEDNLLAPLVQLGQALIACIIVAHATNDELLRRKYPDIYVPGL